MRIGFITDGMLRDVEEKKEMGIADIYAAAFGSIGEVDYEKEIAGESNEMEDVALFSHHNSCVSIVGCYTNTKGILRRSAIVADRGRILGISDVTGSWDNEDYKCGSGIRVYDTSAGKIGLLVGRDIFFPDLVKNLSECGAELVICIYEQLGENVEQLLIRADAFRYGVPICICAHGFCEVADTEGKLLFASPALLSYCKVEPVGEYHLIQTRRRGYLQRKNMY